MLTNPPFERQISVIRTHLCTRTPFFGSLALYARVEVSDKIPTAATDGKTIYINLDFFTPLSTAQQEGVFIHEVLHAALLHVPRGRGRDKDRWNIAADIVVNGILASEGYELPEGGIREPELERFSVEEVYDLIQQEPYSSKLCNLQCLDLLSGNPNASANRLGDGQISQSQQKALEDYWHQACEQASVIAETTMYGSLPSSLMRELLRVNDTQLDWRHYLWRYIVQTPIDFSGFDRRFVGRKIYLDTLSGETVQVIIGVDTSGSIMNEQMQSFLGEVQGILGAYPHLVCDLFYIDTEAHGPYRLAPHSELPTPIGGGGTDFRPFFERITKDYDLSAPLVAVYLTDGYGAFPDSPPSFPTLWVVTPGGLDRSHFPFGEVVRLVN